MTEYLNVFRSGPEHPRRKAVAGVMAILQDHAVRVIPQSVKSFHAGFDLYRARPDNGCSLIVWISMETMRRKGLTGVLINDRHFEQESFRALFRAVLKSLS